MTEESERVTRKKRIDPLLKAAGWRIELYKTGMDLTRYNQYALEEFPTENGPADYALCVDGKILAVIEAKKISLGPQNVLTQAERYAAGISGSPFNYSGFRVPFIYSTNGEIIWYHDLRNPLNRSRLVAKFHTPDALTERLREKFEVSCQRLVDWENAHPMIRPYQAEANAAIEQGIRDRKRQMLVAMATGTGKTYTMVNQIFRLMESGVAKRILFKNVIKSQNQVQFLLNAIFPPNFRVYIKNLINCLQMLFAVIFPYQIVIRNLGFLKIISRNIIHHSEPDRLSDIR